MKQINVKGLSNALLESVGRQIQTSKEGIDFIQAETDELAYVYDPFYKELQAVIKAEKLKKIYNAKAVLNKERNNHYSAIKAIAKGNAYEDDLDRAAVSKGLLHIFKKHDESKKGGSYEMQTTRIGAVIGEIEEEFNREQLDSIGFIHLYNELKEKQVTFEEFMLKHNTDHIKMLEKDTISELKARYINSLDVFVNTVTFISNKTTSDNYIKFHNAIENIVNKAHIDAKVKHHKPSHDPIDPLPLDLSPIDKDQSEIKLDIEPEQDLPKAENTLEE